MRGKMMFDICVQSLISTGPGNKAVNACSNIIFMLHGVWHQFHDISKDVK